MSYRYGQPSQQRSPQSDYLKELVMQKVTNGLLVASAITFFIAYFEVFDPLLFILAFVVEIIAIIGYFFAKSENTIETLYYMFVGSSSVLLGFTVYMYSQVIGFDAILYAFALTSLIVGGIYYYTATKRPDVSGLVKILFPVALIFIVVMIAGIFVVYSNTANLVISIVGAALFSLYLLYDLGRLMNDQYSSPARMAFQIYWDILLIFKFILRILFYSRD